MQVLTLQQFATPHVINFYINHLCNANNYNNLARAIAKDFGFNLAKYTCPDFYLYLNFVEKYLSEDRETDVWLYHTKRHSTAPMPYPHCSVPALTLELIRTSDYIIFFCAV